MSVVIETTKGVFTVDLYIEQRPKICKNFLKLCKIKYYNGCLFHTVQPSFIAQTGDPSGVGRDGGESVYRHLYGDQARFFEGDLLPKMKHKTPGTLSMVNTGNNMFGSQFFVTLRSDLDALDGEHCVFGEIVEGSEDTVTTFNETIVDTDSRPYQDIRITHTVVLDDPFDDPSGLEVPDRSPVPPKEAMGSRIAADEDLDEHEGMDDDEIEEMISAKEAKAQATILEMVGDLPEADCAPPENVLFVCKLNPVTNDDDLEIIFSRFGKVVSCEVIRDKKTGDSLQYAFVEFEDQKACEAAYFKMDNVLIDDRRIHVDFSQSVSKYRWKGKGRLEIVGQDKAEGRKEAGSRSGGNRPANNGKQQGRRDFKRRSRSPQDRKRPRSRSPEKTRYRQKSRSRSPERRRRSRDREDRERRKERQRSRSVEKNKDASSSGSSRRRRSGSRSGDERRRRSRSRDDRRGRKSSSHKRAERRSRSRSRDRYRDKR